MAELRKSALKALMFILLLAGLNYLYKYTRYRDEVMEAFPALPELEAAANADIVYIGESSNITYGDLDVSKASIHEFLQMHYPGLKVGGITQAAAHAGHFLSILRNIPRNSRVKALVVTLNLRSFNAQWMYSRQDPALSKKMVLIGSGPSLWRKFLLSFRQFNQNSAAQQEALFLEKWRSDSLHFPYPMPFHNVVGWDTFLTKRIQGLPRERQAAKRLAIDYVKAFAFEIDTLRHPRIADLDALVSLAAARGWKLVLNLLPENTELATELLGDTLTRFMHQNADLLSRRYTARGAIVVNNLQQLPSARFLEQEWTTEHYDETGRRKVAQAVAEALKAQFPGEFRQVQIDALSRPAFHFNDFEGKTKWSQMHTCVTGQAWSGKLASMVGGKEKFSATYTTAVSALDSSRLDSVLVEFWLRQDALDHYAGLAFEASGDSVAYMWDTVGLRRFSHTVGAWSQVKVRWPCFEGLPQANVFKIYVYNPSEQAIWVDDMRIEFKGRE